MKDYQLSGSGREIDWQLSRVSTNDRASGTVTSVMSHQHYAIGLLPWIWPRGLTHICSSSKYLITLGIWLIEMTTYKSHCTYSVGLIVVKPIPIAKSSKCIVDHY